MRTIVIPILFGLCCFNCFGQSINETKYRHAKNVFNSTEYVKGSYDRFYGQIIPIDSNTFKIGEKVLEINSENKVLKQLILLGIFNVDIIFGKNTSIKSKAEIDSLDVAQKVFYNISRNDSLSICCFEELDKLNPNPQTKRFKFWVMSSGASNLTEYYIELYNEKAIKETEMDEFIKNSKMSFYYKGTLIL